MSVKYVYVPERRFSPVAIAAALLSLLLIAGIATFLLWPDSGANQDNLTENAANANAGDSQPAIDGEPLESLASLIADDTATVYVVDNSGSIEDYVPFLTDQVEKIGTQAQENSTAALIIFGTQNHELLPIGPIDETSWSVASTQITNELGATYMFTAALRGIELLRGVDPNTNRKLVILTDGLAQDEALMTELVDQANDLGVSIDTIALGNDAYNETLHDLSDETGGTFYDWQSADQAITNQQTEETP